MLFLVKLQTEGECFKNFFKIVEFFGKYRVSSPVCVKKTDVFFLQPPYKRETGRRGAAPYDVERKRAT